MLENVITEARTIGNTYQIAQDAHASGYPIAGFIHELYEGAEVYIPPPFSEGITFRPNNWVVLEGTILSVR